MSLTLEESRLHKAYVNLENLARHPVDLPARIKLATDEGFDALTAMMSDNTLQYCKDDRAEALVARIFEFICKSNGVDPANFAPLETV
ncbi:hypothetical protein RCPACIFIC_89 [Rhodobacter phage RcPacific]|nr:hypothetical protein RCPACIFIC_89 [Rhodobacter phage RcPacific]